MSSSSAIAGAGGYSSSSPLKSSSLQRDNSADGTLSPASTKSAGTDTDNAAVAANAGATKAVSEKRKKAST